MTTARAVLKRDTVSGEALFILKNLRENSQPGRSNKLAEVKTALEPAVSLEFDAYFFFLRKFHYIAMDREAQLKLTDSRRAGGGRGRPRPLLWRGGRVLREQIARTGPRCDDADATDRRPLPLRDRRQHRRRHASPSRDRRLDDPLLPPPRSRRVRCSAVRFAALPRPCQRRRRRCESAATPGASSTSLRKCDPLGSGPLGTVFRGKHNALGTRRLHQGAEGHLQLLLLPPARRGAQAAEEGAVRAGPGAAPGAWCRSSTRTSTCARPYFVMELLLGLLRERLEGAGGKGLPVAQCDPDLPPAVLRAARRARLGPDPPQPQAGERPLRRLRATRSSATSASPGSSRSSRARACPRSSSAPAAMSYLAPELITARRTPGPRRTSTGWASSSTRC